MLQYWAFKSHMLNLPNLQWLQTVIVQVQHSPQVAEVPSYNITHGEKKKKKFNLK